MTAPATDPTIDNFDSDVLTIETEGHVATLWLDRPKQRNALGPDFWTDLPRAMGALGSSADIRVVVLAARGPHFSVGLDLKAVSEPGGMFDASAGDPGKAAPSMATRGRRARSEVLRLQSSITAVATCPKPVIAAIHGFCIGGGVDLAAACDIRVASVDAIFSVRETKMAMVADLGSLQRLPHIIGKGHVAELAYTGKDITADRAAQIGLVNDVAPDVEGVWALAYELAEAIAANSPLAVEGTKAVLTIGEDRSVAEGLDYVATWNAAALASDDLTEAMMAFMEKRPADFTGR
jgi:enoyl-CoA hydratase